MKKIMGVLKVIGAAYVLGILLGFGFYHGLQLAIFLLQIF